MRLVNFYIVKISKILYTISQGFQKGMIVIYTVEWGGGVRAGGNVIILLLLVLFFYYYITLYYYFIIILLYYPILSDMK